jgi:uncharacterized membrane protein
MRTMLIQEDVKLVEDRIKKFETATGCELLIVVADSSDPYPAAPWRFGFMTTFLLSFLFSFYFEFHHAYLWPICMALLLAFTTWLGHFRFLKRYALVAAEVSRECREKAIELFQTLGTSQVKHKVTAMIMISVLEKNIQVLVDETLKTKITQAELDGLVADMGSHFREGHMGLGLVQSIETLELKILRDFNGKVSEIPPSELKDTIHFIGL